MIFDKKKIKSKSSKENKIELKHTYIKKKKNEEVTLQILIDLR